MKYILAFILICMYALCCTAQPTFFGQATSPADNSASATSPVSVTPPASMVAGDLVVFMGLTRTTSATVAISDAGGQSWTSETASGTTDQTIRIFWCRYNGTWSADPSISFSSALCTSVGMMVFRPTAGTMLWAVDQAIVNTPYSAPSTPFTVTVTGVTNGQNNNVTAAFVASTDDNAYNALTGTGWNAGYSGNIYRRNTSGSDHCHVALYKISASSGATGNVSVNQSSVGGDAGTTAIISFYQYATGVVNTGVPLNLLD